MFGVCFRYDRHGWIQNQWEFVLSHFVPDDVWVRGAPDDWKSYHKPVHIETAKELPKERPLIVLAHPQGRYVQGVESLGIFEHPKDAIYLFGGDDVLLTEEDDLGRKPDAIVYIPVKKYEMYSFVAAAITLYDRLVKNG